MTPFYILRRTPKTNCGDCGHPTCLAFAAAVATSGFSPEKCPYINLEGLTINKENATSPSEEKEQALLQHLKTKIADLDFSDIHQRFGIEWHPAEPDTLRFDYLGQNIILNKSGLTIDGNEASDPRDQILLYNYIHSSGGRAPNDQWIGLESLPNSISKTKTLATYCEDRLATLFSSMKTDRILTFLDVLGGRKLHGISASLGMVIPVLPLVPHQVLFWEAEPDDGFDAKVKVLFDEHVMDFLDLESLVFAAERLADRFKYLLEK